MIDNMQDFETMIGQDLYELKSELRLSLNAQAELDEFLEEHAAHLSEENRAGRRPRSAARRSAEAAT